MCRMVGWLVSVSDDHNVPSALYFNWMDMATLIIVLILKVKAIRNEKFAIFVFKL